MIVSSTAWSASISNASPASTRAARSWPAHGAGVVISEVHLQRWRVMTLHATGARGAKRQGAARTWTTQTAPTPTMWASPSASVGMLALAAFATQLSRQLTDLADAGRTDRMAHRQQTARGADRDTAADVELALGELRRRVPDRSEPDGLDVQQLLDGERVVQLDHVEISGGDPGVAERDAGRLTGERGVEVLASVDGLGSRRRGQHADCSTVVEAEPGDRSVGCDDHGRGALADRAALQSGERSADEGWCEDFVERPRLLALRVRVQRTVLAVLHSHECELLVGRAVVVHVTVREEGEVSERHDSTADEVAKTGGGVRHPELQRLVDADCDRHIGETSRDVDARLAHGRRPRRGRVLDLSHRDARRTEVAIHEPGQAHRCRRGAGVRGLDVLPLDAGVGEGITDRLHAERGVRGLARLLVRMQADADDVHRPEVTQRHGHQANPNLGSTTSLPSSSVRIVTHEAATRDPIASRSTISAMVPRISGPPSSWISPIANGASMSCPW